jgi:hypothetical protein
MRKIEVLEKDPNKPAKTLRDFNGVLKIGGKAVNFGDMRGKAKEQRTLRVRLQ